MSIKLDDKVGKIIQETNDLNWDDFKKYLEEKGFACQTVKYEMSVAKRVVRNRITEDNMYDRCPIITRYVRHDIRRAIRRINEYKKEVKSKCQQL